MYPGTFKYPTFKKLCKFCKNKDEIHKFITLVATITQLHQLLPRETITIGTLRGIKESIRE